MITLIDGKNYIRHKCIQCGKCCMYRNDIFLTPWDVLRIAKFLNLSCESFIHSFGSRAGDIELVIKCIDPNERCIFLEMDNEAKARCKIYPVRPTACYLFPLGEGSNMNRLIVNQDPFCKIGDPILVEDYIAEKSQGRYMYDHINSMIFVAILTKYLEREDRTKAEDDDFFKFLFYNSCEEELNEKIQKLTEV